jgi:hypothetical protein
MFWLFGRNCEILQEVVQEIVGKGRLEVLMFKFSMLFEISSSSFSSCSCCFCLILLKYLEKIFEIKEV